MDDLLHGLDLSLIAERDISENQDKLIRDCLVACFPADKESFSRSRNWHTEPIYRILGVGDCGAVQCHLAVVEQTITVGCVALRVAGVQSVAVRDEYRGKGFADAMLGMAMKEGKRRQLDMGLLFCVEQLEKVYGRCGWRSVGHRRTVMMDEQGAEQLIPGKNIVMYYPLCKDGFPEGEINLCGRDW